MCSGMLNSQASLFTLGGSALVMCAQTIFLSLHLPIGFCRATGQRRYLYRGLEVAFQSSCMHVRL